MNNSARKVLKSKKQFILENYILNDGTLDSLEDNGILNEDLIQRINVRIVFYYMFTFSKLSLLILYK